MKLFERIIWATVLACSLVALGLSMRWSHELQTILDREQYLYLMGTARLVQSMEVGDWNQAIESGRLHLGTYASSYVTRHEEGAFHVGDNEHTKLMDVLRTDFPELLATDPAGSEILD